MKLSEMKIGDIALVKEIIGDSKLARDLHELGLTSGTKVQYLSRGLARGPMLFRFRGTNIALRHYEADLVLTS